MTDQKSSADKTILCDCGELPETSFELRCAKCSDIRAYRVMVKGRGGSDLCIGIVNRSTSYASGERVDGWRFMPQTQAAPSRKVWPTASAALKGRVNAYTLVPV